jgi:hypothetical protein
MLQRTLFPGLILSFLLLQACPQKEMFTPPAEPPVTIVDTTGMDTTYLYVQADGCDGQAYPLLSETPYVLPYPAGFAYPTGLTNCSSSFHSADRGDAYAFDFNMAEGEGFYAIRDGIVRKVINNRDSFGQDGTSGNYLVVEHADTTFALYYHSPRNGIEVSEGQRVQQGQKLGVTGRSGYAGYPHLHLIVVRDSYAWPYSGIPISFRNVYPRHVVLKTNYLARYLAR